MSDDGPRPLADIIRFVDRGRRAQWAADAIAMTELWSHVRQHVDAARALLPRGLMSLNASRQELELALLELGELGRALSAHFERFGEKRPPENAQETRSRPTPSSDTGES